MSQLKAKMHIWYYRIRMIFSQKLLFIVQSLEFMCKQPEIRNSLSSFMPLLHRRHGWDSMTLPSLRMQHKSGVSKNSGGLRSWFTIATHRGTGFRIPPLPRAEFGRLVLEWHNWPVTPREGGGLSNLRSPLQKAPRAPGVTAQEDAAWRRRVTLRIARSRWGRQGRGVCGGSKIAWGGGGNWRNRGVIGYQIGRKRDKI